ncbi:hypothetical protein [Hyphomonas polymorpha]|uniref:hypothetical protein n=1 Tax=Hyphomonas polymorpha TaxID=74319 RepID=UPI0005590FCA|nr:hypothetical protein [Hyphomonas polymorpha]
MRSKVALATMAIDGWSICGKSENGVYALGMMLDEVIAGLTEVEEILHPSKPKAVENEAA